MVSTNYNSIFEETFIPFKSVHPKSSIAKSSYSRGGLMYIVTDELVVTPMWSISTMSYLNRLIF